MESSAGGLSPFLCHGHPLRKKAEKQMLIVEVPCEQKRPLTWKFSAGPTMLYHRCQVR
jgi:hypothetical protein